MQAPYVWTFRTANTLPPTVVSTTPTNAANGVAPSISPTVTFSRAMDGASINASSLTFAPEGGAAVAATVTYDPATLTATLTPAAALAAGTDYVLSLSSAIRAADHVAILPTTSGFRTAGTAYRLFSSALRPLLTGLSSANGRPGPGPFSLELGVKITVSEPEVVHALRYYKSPGETGTHTARLWTESGTELTSAAFVSETASGWQEAQLATPWNIAPGNYLVSVNSNSFFVQTLSGLAGGAGTGSLSAGIGANGVYGDTAGLFPMQSFSSSNYFLDLAVSPDTTVPDTTITASPTNPAASSSATFSFSSSKLGSSFACALDSATFVPCTSPATYTGIADGSHTFEVRATDAVGTDATPASFTWTVDATPPDTTITSTPTAVTNATSASFGFTATESPATFECSLDAAPFAGCTSPNAYPGPLAEGSHTFAVRATDSLGNTGASPASFTWTIDTTAATASITSSPASLTNTAAASFSFTSEAGATFTCALDAAAFASCSSPQSYTGVADGSHTFQVKATDAAGNTGAAVSYTWTIDTAAPTASITASPTNPSNSAAPSFSFSSEAGASFTCALDGAAFTGCSSPTSYTGVADGSYTFQVKATDVAGNTGAAASYTWTVDTAAPTASITASPTNPSNSASPSFSFTSEVGASFTCALDTPTFSSCSSPKSYSGLADGSHTFQVKATDAAGNTGPTASYTWTSDTAAPTASITASPTNPSNNASPSFSFTSEAGASFTCALDAAAFAACSSPKSYSGLVGRQPYRPGEGDRRGRQHRCGGQLHLDGRYGRADGDHHRFAGESEQQREPELQLQLRGRCELHLRARRCRLRKL